MAQMQWKFVSPWCQVQNECSWLEVNFLQMMIQKPRFIALCSSYLQQWLPRLLCSFVRNGGRRKRVEKAHHFLTARALPIRVHWQELVTWLHLEGMLGNVVLAAASYGKPILGVEVEAGMWSGQLASPPHTWVSGDSCAVEEEEAAELESEGMDLSFRVWLWPVGHITSPFWASVS